MSSIWPWLAVAGAGALHGLNPATGWMFAAASGVRSREPAQALRALLPIAVGHAASVALVAAAFVAWGVSLDGVVVKAIAAGVVVLFAIHLFRKRAAKAGLALWSCAMSTVHGAGLMLVPAFIPLCMGDGSAREITASGSFALALAVVAVHTAAMLAVTGVIAAALSQLASRRAARSDTAVRPLRRAAAP
jgi:hypothetical protein